MRGADIPVLVFWPGYGWQPSRYAILAEQLASDGYVVVGISPDYRTGSLADTVSARQLVEGWSDEMISVAARLDSLNGDPSQPFAGHLDVTGFGFLGTLSVEPSASRLAAYILAVQVRSTSTALCLEA